MINQAKSQPRRDRKACLLKIRTFVKAFPSFFTFLTSLAFLIFLAFITFLLPRLPQLQTPPSGVCQPHFVIIIHND